ncbi:MAG: hypothetical protein DDT31_00035 [Syntrophomonadaceae bacterium]|nr:hypothetical protein [Bacillota bacterium]
MPVAGLHTLPLLRWGSVAVVNQPHPSESCQKIGEHTKLLLARPRIVNLMSHFVYIYFHPITGIPFYVGEGKSQYRAAVHWSKIRNGKKTHNRLLTEYLRALLHNAMEPLIVVHSVSDKEAGLETEKSLICELGRTGKEEYGVLCNRCSVGSDNTGTGNFSRSRPADVRLKIAAGHLGKPKPKHTPEHNAAISAALTGKIRAQSHCDNLSRATLGKPHKKTARAYFTVKSPDMVITEVVGNLDGFCVRHNLNRKSMYNSLQTGKPISAGKTKGWQLVAIRTN